MSSALTALQAAVSFAGWGLIVDGFSQWAAPPMWRFAISEVDMDGDTNGDVPMA